MNSPKKRPRFFSLRHRFKATPPARHTFIPGEPASDVEATLSVYVAFDKVKFDASKWNDVVPQSAKIDEGVRYLKWQPFSVKDFESQLSWILTCEGIKHSITSLTDSGPFGSSSKITARWSTPEKRGGWVERPIGQKLARALKA